MIGPTYFLHVILLFSNQLLNSLMNYNFSSVTIIKCKFKTRLGSKDIINFQKTNSSDSLSPLFLQEHECVYISSLFLLSIWPKTNLTSLCILRVLLIVFTIHIRSTLKEKIVSPRILKITLACERYHHLLERPRVYKKHR